MCKFNLKSGDTRIDPCMEYLLVELAETDLKIVACCCGHNKYTMTIVVEGSTGNHFDLISQVDIPRRKRFYKRDKPGYHYIPEAVAYWKRK